MCCVVAPARAGAGLLAALAFVFAVLVAAAPNAHAQGNVWYGTVTVAEVVTPTTTSYGYFSGRGGALSHSEVTVGATSYTIIGIIVGSGSIVETLGIVFGDALTTEDLAALSLHVGSESFAFSDATPSISAGHAIYQWADTGLDWSSLSSVFVWIGDTRDSKLNVSNANGNEGEDVVFTVTLSPSRPASVEWTATVESGDTAEDADFRGATSGTLAFVGGLLSGEVRVPTAGDADTDNDTFTLTLTSPSNAAFEGGGTTLTAVGTITDTGMPNVAPVFRSTKRYMTEHWRRWMFLRATDTDAADEITGYEIVGGDDQAQFKIDSDNGTLVFKNEVDYENPADQNNDNVYEVTVRATSGEGTRAMSTDADLVVYVSNWVDENLGVRVNPGGGGEEPQGQLESAVHQGAGNHGLQPPTPAKRLAGGHLDGGDRR